MPEPSTPESKTPEPWSTNPESHFYHLTPDRVLDAIESTGQPVLASILVLNSYENRVYQVGIAGSEPLIAKFYRPGRWSDAAILEEHQYTQALAELEIPVVSPLTDPTGNSLFHHQGYRFALYPRRGGRAPETGRLDQLEWLGRLLGRIHHLGRERPFRHRFSLDVASYAELPSAFLLHAGFIPDELAERYQSLVGELSKQIQHRLEHTADLRLIRVHGDCHIGNILWRDDSGPHFVDFDDCCMAPAMQDLWMLIAGDHNDQLLQLDTLLEAYIQFTDFNDAELALIEPLRTLRMIHYYGWLGRRWKDPAFPANFPWFHSGDCWMKHLADLEEQLEAISRKPLARFPA